MSIKSGLFGAITTVVLILVLGNRWVVDNAPDGGPAPQAGRSLTGFFGWDPDRVFDPLRTATYVSLVVLVVAVFVLGGLAGRARPLAAFVGGWGAAMGAAAVSSIVFAVIAGDRTFSPSDEFLDRVYFAVSSGTGAMATVGWLVGLAVLLGSFGAKQPKVVPAGAPAPAPYPAAGGPAPYAPADPYAPPAGAYPAPAGTPEPFGAPAPAPAPSAPAPAAPPPSPGGPVIGAPPDRTEVQPRPPD